MDGDLALDGNAVGGLLAEVFVQEITAAATSCDGCGAIEELGAARAYVNAPGTVLRCLHCGSVLLRLVHDGARWWIDLRGVRWLRFGPPAPTGAV